MEFLKSVPKHKLSKSTFMYGVQCSKRLWLHKFRPKERDVEEAMQTAIFQQGTDVGLFARQLFPGGVDASPENPYTYQKSVLKTSSYIRKGASIIYEAAFQFEGVLCAIDILVKKNDAWYAFEVKATNSVKEVHQRDAALQYFVMKNAGLNLADISVIHLNRNYVRQGDLNISQLFISESVLKYAENQQPYIESKSKELLQVLELPEVPDISTGDHCFFPYPCNFQKFCFGEELNIRIPDDDIIDLGKINSFTNSLAYPIYFLEIQSWMSAIPEADGHWPYRQIPFQFSMHVQDGAGSLVLPYFYLAENLKTGLHVFLENLLSVTGTHGSVVLAGKREFISRLEEMKNDFPEYSESVQQLQSRIIELEYFGCLLKRFEIGFDDSNSFIKSKPDASAAFYNLKYIHNTEDTLEIRKELFQFGNRNSLLLVEITENLLFESNNIRE